jgi:hypothetical protein
LKPLITKSDLRRELDRQIEAFVREGGRVNEIPRGISGRNPGEGMLPETPMISDKPKEDEKHATAATAQKIYL